MPDAQSNLASVPQPEDYSAEYPHIRLFSNFDGPHETLQRIVNDSTSAPDLSEVDQSIERLCKAYLVGTDQQRAQQRQEVKNGWCLLHYSERMAVSALRTGVANLLNLAGAAISLENSRNDPRNTVTDLAIIHHVAIKIGVDWNVFLKNLGAISSVEMAKDLAAIAAVSTDPSSMKLENYLHRESHDANGPTIQWFTPQYNHPPVKYNRPPDKAVQIPDSLARTIIQQNPDFCTQITTDDIRIDRDPPK